MTSTSDASRAVSRRHAFGLLAGATAALCTPALALGKGDFRKLSFVNSRTGEWLDSVYWVDGTYIPEAMEAVNVILRDWREDAVKPIAPATLDILAATHRLLDCAEPFEVVSGYRTARTNAMLRRTSRGVAKNSYHVRAMAVDIALKSRSVRQIARAARSLEAGGVGRYSASSFVHLDSGPVRDWGR